ncbi:unnamed protein product [Prunus armeniaca]
MIFQLGCSHGLPGIFACLEGAAAIHFQDFNAEVLQCLTIPNVNSNVPSFQRPALQVTKCDAGTEIHFLAGDWRETHKLLPYAQNIEKDLNVSTGKGLDSQNLKSFSLEFLSAGVLASSMVAEVGDGSSKVREVWKLSVK